jgi:tRNA-dihydrouridine synthase B
MTHDNPKQEIEHLDVFHRHGIKTHVLMLAPMEGLTNSLYRNLIIDAAPPDIVATEFIRISQNNQKVPKIARHGIPLQIQFMASSAQILASSLEALYSTRSISSADWIDLNVGCPSRKVNAKGAGAALLLQPKKLREMTEAMRSVHKGPLSLKTRLGLNSEDEYPEILEALAECPLDFVTIHARTRCSRYEGSADWHKLAIATNRLPFPVIGNGDITSPELAQHVLNTTGVRGVMCGRGAVINPFIFRDIATGREPEPTMRRTELKGFIDKLASGIQAAGHETGRFKEYLNWIARNPVAPPDLFKKARGCVSWSDILATIQECFALPTYSE